MRRGIAMGRKRLNRPASVNGVSDTRIRMMKSSITIQEVRDYIIEKDNFTIPHSVVSVSLDEALVQYIEKMANELCSQIEEAAA